jgi:uncharacterized membrane protein YphA (DoxX/SURF4 family)
MANASAAQRALKLGYGLVPIVAGADKFTNLLVDWEKYLSPEVAEALPVGKRTFMKLVGLVEIGAGLMVLSRRTRLGAFTVAAWLTAITGNLVLDGDWDIAARDALLAVGAAALGMLSPASARRKEPAPMTRRERPEGMAAVLH